MYRFSLTLITVLFVPIIGHAAEGLKTLEQKASYSFGVDFAKRLKQQGIDLDISALTRGIMDAASGKELAFEAGEMGQFKAEYTEKLRAELVQKQQEMAAKNLEAGKKFLADNAKKEGVVTTDSGLQYKVIKSGDGPTPKPEDTVTTHYRGTLIDGREFDSSYSRGQPASFPVKGVIKGWTEALQLMKVGDKWELYIPADLAYGAQKRGEVIEPNSTLLFELELLEIK
ncbi:MAG: FKBP-type peptidyl-prolyl cis-trans isomerase [Gammaproteobacteria bacterium]